jgi:hypothetical protein
VEAALAATRPLLAAGFDPRRNREQAPTQEKPGSCECAVMVSWERPLVAMRRWRAEDHCHDRRLYQLSSAAAGPKNS